MNLKTLISIYSIDRYIENSTFALWFFHNSIRFKVNKVWLGLVVRQALIVYRGFASLDLHITIKKRPPLKRGGRNYS